jgi:hypothetical protein
MENVSSKFKVYIKSRVVGDVVGHLAEKVSQSVSSDWDTPFDNTVGGFNVAAQVVGGTSVGQNLGVLSGKFEFQLRQVWKGTAPVSVEANLEFFAETNEMTDVYAPVMKLMRMASPGRGSSSASQLIGSLQPPGPAILGGGGDLLSVRFGNILYLQNVVITGVSVEWGKQVGTSGRSLYAKVKVSMTSNQILTKEDLV